MAEALSSLQLALLAQRADDQRRLLAAEPIAVVGMGLRFPAGEGKADLRTPEAFWQFLLDGGDAVSEVPASRWNLERYYDPRPGTPGKMHCRHGAFLAAVDQFDPARFGISPREAQAIDPQHRLLLEVTADALERAALTPQSLRGMAAGVYLGLCTTDYAWRQLRGGAPDTGYDMYFATGTSFSMAPGRLAYALGLQGPALAVDTACSSSLVAVDLACRSLRDRSTDLAIAGGVSVLLTPVNSLCFARSGMMAADGHCKTFDAAADGYVRGEGSGVVVLKRLGDALAAGDPVLAVLRGSAVNQDGASAGLTVPSGEAQAALIQRTLAQAQLDGNSIDVLEAHGTGTPLGDPIELKALAPLYGRLERQAPLRVGSVKTNLGHLEGAAGIAGLLKAVQMVQHGQVPPHLHLREPTPYFPWQQWKIAIPTEAEPWPSAGRPRRVAVSSFGFSGTNAHVLVEQAPAEVQLPPPPPVPEGDWLLLSARSERGVRALAEAMATWLLQQPANRWPAICATSRQAHSSMPWRLAVKAATSADAEAQLRQWLDGQAALATAESPSQAPRLACRLSAASTAAHWDAWRAYGVEATALVYPPETEALATDLAGHPPLLRLIPAGADAEQELQRHGYQRSIALVPPTPERLVELWLAGVQVSWAPLAPQGPWQRQVLPTTPLDPIRCWIEEAEAEAEGPALEGLEHQRLWQPVAAGSRAVSTGPLVVLAGPSGFAEELALALQGREVFACVDLEALDQALGQGSTKPELLLAAATQPSWLTGDAAPLGPEFWSRWLPLLQGLIARAPHLARVHWWLPNSTPSVEAVASLARSWGREAGALAGALLRAAHCSDLAGLLRLAPEPGSEWRIGPSGGAEQLQLQPLDLSKHPRAPLVLPPTGTTLITGGLGALGLAVAGLLQRCGARHLTLVGRRPPQEHQLHAIAALERAGAEVAVELVDITDPAAVQGLFARLQASGRPLAGLIHAAGVLDDGLVIHQTAERCAAVTAPKVQGALLLDRFSRPCPHEFFVVFSSLAAAVGSPGQVAYSAANGFLDGLMAERRAAGLPALSLAWGPWAGEGMAAQAPVGVQRITVAEGLALLERWLQHRGEPSHLVLARLDSSHPDHPLAPRLRVLAEAVRVASPEQAQQLAETCLAELLAELGGFDLAELSASTRLDVLGLDSLMAVDLATAVQAGLGVSLGLGALAGEPTLGTLAAHVLSLLDNPAASDGAAVDLGQEAVLPADVAAALGVPDVPEPRSAMPEAVLLTGATGFLGAFLLADQLQRHPQLTVYCLVRADGPGPAKARVRANLEHYGLWCDGWAARIVGVPGDLAQPQLGLDGDSWHALARRLGGILHNAAQLSYVAPYGQLKAPNVDGTVEVLRLAVAPVAEGMPPMRLEYISSTSVYEASAYRGQTLDEAVDLAEWQGIHLGYSQTKWVSERLVVAAAGHGLPVRLYRPPLIAGHSKSGAWHEQDFLHRLVRGCLALRQAPQIAMELDLVPVDYVVAAVGSLAWEAVATSPDVLHLHHPQPVLWADFLVGLIEQGAPLEAVELEPWLGALASDSTNPLYPLQPFFTHRWGPEQLTYPQLNQPDIKARPTLERTRQRLEHHGVDCPPFEALIQPYARTFLADLMVSS